MFGRVLVGGMIAVLALCCGCGGGNSPRARQGAINDEVLRQFRSIEKSFQDASDSQAELAAISDMNRQARDKQFTYTLTLFGASGSQISISEWDQHRAELPGARVEIELSNRVSPVTVTFNHKLIDPDNFVFLLME